MINFDIDDIVLLKRNKYLVQHALFRPTISAHVDAVPTTELFRQAAPFAAMLGHVKHRVQHLAVRYFHVATLNRQQGLNQFKLLLCDFHSRIIHLLVLTGPRTALINLPIGNLAAMGRFNQTMCSRSGIFLWRRVAGDDWALSVAALCKNALNEAHPFVQRIFADALAGQREDGVGQRGFDRGGAGLADTLRLVALLHDFDSDVGSLGQA